MDKGTEGSEWSFVDHSDGDTEGQIEAYGGDRGIRAPFNPECCQVAGSGSVL